MDLYSGYKISASLTLFAIALPGAIIAAYRNEAGSAAGSAALFFIVAILPMIHMSYLAADSIGAVWLHPPMSVLAIVGLFFGIEWIVKRCP